jgi:hydroxymethylpyrimidine/phosphomethylpyrimidine kinase
MNLVVDPVIVSTSGKPLLTLSARKAIKEHLLPLAVIVTPNLSEAEALSGMKIMNEQDRDYAAGRILDLGPSYVLIKGGHGPSAEAEDVLYGGPQVMTFSTPRRKGSFHGTGCVLSSAITVFIARGYAVEKAVEKGKQFVDRLLKAAMPVGRNRKTLYFQM